MESLSSEDFPLRPLLFAVGAAATALSIYCLIKRAGGKKSAPGDPVWDQATEEDLVDPPEVHQDQMIVSLAEEKLQKSVETITQLEKEKSELIKQVATLRDRETHNLLQVENEELKKTLIHEKLSLKVSVAEAEEKHQKSVETIAQLEEEKSELSKQVETLRDNVEEMGDLLHKHNMESANLTKACVEEWEELLKVSIAEAEEKLQKSVETITQLEKEKSQLSKHLETLRDTIDTEWETEREAYNLLQLENNDLKKNLIHEKLLLKVSVAEAEEKHQKDVETISHLKEVKSELIKQVETLRDTVKEWEREREAHHLLQVENDKIMKTLVHEKELMKISMAETEDKHQRTVETMTQLEVKKSELSKQLETLRDSVKEWEKEREAHNNLQAENDEMMKTLIQQKELIKVSIAEAEEKHQKSMETITQLEKEKSELSKQVMLLSDTVKECEREREALSNLQGENNELKKNLIHEKLLLKVSIAEAEEKHQKSVETITQLEEEKSNLSKQVETFRDTMKQCESEQEAHNLLQEENNELKKNLIHEKLLLKISMAEAEDKTQKFVESITQLEKEKSDLTKEVESLRDTVKECETERETHSLLQTENDEMMKTLVHEKELLKVSMVEAKKKHQMAVETIAHLEKEKSDLTKLVETLRNTVKECEKEQETHSSLQVETNEMFKSLFHEKELLKVSVAEAEEKHQRSEEMIVQLKKEKSDLAKQVERLKDIGHLLIDRNVKFANLTKMFEQEREELMKVSLAKGEEKHQRDVETIAQLEEEKSDLTKQVERLRDIVQDMGNDLFESHRGAENNNDREHLAPSVLQLEYDELKKMPTHKEELLKVSLAEVEEKQQKALETIAQLEVEKSFLSEEVETLRTTVQELGKDLYDTHRECDGLTDEFEREQEAYRSLQLVYQELKKTYKEDLSKEH